VIARAPMGLATIASHEGARRTSATMGSASVTTSGARIDTLRSSSPSSYGAPAYAGHSPRYALRMWGSARSAAGVPLETMRPSAST